ncbi:MAG TPA: hypothetical protein VM223_22090 [Planctomycetota bacterium]|nr:hypothetical protein [Planctomycetota bacterium]
MATGENAGLRIELSDDGLGMAIADKRRDCVWTVDATARQITSRHGGAQARKYPLPGGVVHTINGNTIESVHGIDGGQIVCRWALEADHVALTVECRGTDVDAGLLALPGRFQAAGLASEVLVPQYQGALLRHTGETWENVAGRGGHTGMSMGMAAYLNNRAGLLVTPDELVDWRLVYGDDATAPYAYFLAAPGAVEGWRPMTIRICPCDPGVTAVTKRYRRWAQARGQWVPWETKIAAKPMLEDLFGAVMVFIGYVHDPETDYVANTRALRDFGFESIFMYPVRFAHYTQQFTMAGGRPPIWLDDATIEQLKAIGGVHPAPWAWTIEGIDDGSDAMHAIFRHTREGGLSGGWAMDNQRWQHVCTPYQIEFIRRRLAGDMRAVDWLHFDVNATLLPGPCFRRDHALHGNRPLPSRAEVDEVRRLLSAETVGNRVVSSEGFNDACTAAYDIGSTKMIPLFQESSPRAMPVPLSMLVYHDCCIQDWWEMHSYNENPCWNPNTAHTGAGALGMATSGVPHLKAAQDALYGLPPNVFPFGYQYGWKDQPCGETFGFRMLIMDPHVQEALACALPVARLHKRIGKLEMLGFEFLSEDRFVQRTTFADGTRVVANLGSGQADVPGIGVLPAKSWRMA